MGRKSWLVLCLAIFITLAGASGARAGTYVIENCPSAPGGNGNAGAWTVFESPQAPQSSCAGPVGSYIGPQSGEMHPNSNAGVQIAVPSGSGIAIREAQIWWTAVQSISGAHVYAVVSASSGAFWQSFAPAEYRFSPLTLQPPSTTTELTLDAYCSADDGGYGCTFGGGENPILQLFGAQLTLEDNSLPTGNATGGGLAGSGTVSGTQALTYTASDPNSGVRAVDLLVDGKQVAQNDYATRCPYQNFLACPATVSDSISWNTASIGNGAHEVAIEVVSAAGDTAIVDDHMVTVDNEDNGPSSAPNLFATAATGSQICTGSASNQAKLTARWSRTVKTILTGQYGTREHVVGRLTNASGQAIADATIEVCATPTDTGAQTSIVASAHTDSTGVWNVALPRGVSSSVLRFVYPGQASDIIPAATTLTLRVHAGVALHIAPRVTSVGRRIYFSGTVHGPIPPGGKQVVLEASSGGGWIEFDTIRTDADGRYRASYRFKFPGPVTYRFRVISPFESGFPFLGGISNGVAIREI